VQITRQLIVLCGPTGIGKTTISIELAQSFDAEIISADSRQIFKEMGMGTAVPGTAQRQAVPHHFVQSHSIFDSYNASRFEEEVIHFLNKYFQRKPVALMVGGSGMYIDAVCKGIDNLPTIKAAIRNKWRNIYEEQGIEYLQYKVKEIDPVYYDKVDRKNHKRLLKAIEVYEQTGKAYSSFLKNSVKSRPFRIHKIGVNTGREQLYRQINQRVDQMIQEGLVEEAQKLYPHRKLQALNTVGYKELFQYFDGNLSLDEAIEQIKNHSRAYARRQLTWFRRDDQIRWFSPDQTEKIIDRIKEDLNIRSNG
jgi:tRNA dimethylallyltransferase